MKLIIFFLSSIFAFDHSHKDWTKVLKKYVSPQGLVKYAALTQDMKKDPSGFKAYLSSLEKVSKSEFITWNKFEQMAFYINAYNAFTVKLIVDHYPLDSITDIGGFFWMITKKPWKTQFFSLFNGEIKSLDPIENDYLRPKYKDYRIHGALNCASFSCPLLKNKAYTGKNLDQELDDQMKVWLTDKTRNVIGKELEISKIFDWYESDFKDWGGGIKAVLKKYSPKSLHADIDKADIDYLKYNWDLNKAPL